MEKMRYAVLFLSLFIVFAGVVVAQDLPVMIEVDGGTFLMGVKKGYKTPIDESPQHEVTVSTFKMSATPITVRQYRFYCESIGEKMPEKPLWGWIDDHPIVNLNWHNAKAYTEWLSLQTGENYRLPTESEWEYAAGGGVMRSRSRYSGGDSLEMVGWNAGKSTQPVGQKIPNELGLYDMTGNVWELCEDWYDVYFYRQSSSINPKGPEDGVCRVIRGGSWKEFNCCSITRRGKISPNYGMLEIGFRVVVSDY